MQSKLDLDLFAWYADEVVYRADGMLEFHRLLKNYACIGKMPGATPVDPFSLLRHKRMDRYMIETLLMHAAGLSLLFFPAAKGVHRRRGEKLRELFEVGDESPLGNRDLRNALLHTDERLDGFFKGYEKVRDGILTHFSLPQESTFGIGMDGFTAEWYEGKLSMEEGANLLAEARRVKAKAAMHIPALGLRNA
ncbi:hypothetical protein [Deinococcus navajonensis]|uniref:Uncharacterized protein n=1 Tax=Deinococcus navajonensis TaxID=309884 RepID=A0ABV8XR57_9DEIO